MTRRALIVVAILAIVAAACRGSDSGGATGEGASGSAPATSRPSSDATLSIASPSDGEVVGGDSVDLRVRLQGARLVAATSTDLAPDEGHLHVLLDDELISMTSGLEQDVGDLTPGQHVIQVEFVANDHAPFDPRVIAGVSFEVKP